MVESELSKRRFCRISDLIRGTKHQISEELGTVVKFHQSLKWEKVNAKAVKEQKGGRRGSRARSCTFGHGIDLAALFFYWTWGQTEMFSWTWDSLGCTLGHGDRPFHKLDMGTDTFTNLT